ncbi:MAG: hypothetical protein MJ238_07055, partial [Bacilli bacterium]|nr:hypothetical protein [Bacilli bacterium]
NGVATPSLFQYEEDSDGLKKVTDLYSIFSIAHVSMMGSYMREFSAVNVGPNKFILTNDNIVSIFQFMSMYGMSIAGYLSGCTVEVLDFETNHFKVVLDLGNYGSITSTFTDLTSTGTPVDKVSNDAYTGAIDGIEYHEEIKDLCDNYFTKDNFVLSGIKQVLANGVSTEYPYEIHCTEDYFYVDYTSAFSSDTSWGCALVNANTEITDTDDSGSHTKKVPYDACYGFSKNKDGSFYFDSFIGPLPSFGEDWLEVDELPETGFENTLYIIKESDGKNAYRWCQVSEGVYGYAKYSSWMNTIGEVPFDGASATYYLDKTPVGTYAPNYFEKTAEHKYRTNDASIYQGIASTMFGWGFQGTTTWMDYINDAFININRNGDVIESADIGLHVTDASGKPQGIYYTMHDWGKGNLASVDSFLNGKIGG